MPTIWPVPRLSECVALAVLLCAGDVLAAPAALTEPPGEAVIPGLEELVAKVMKVD